MISWVGVVVTSGRHQAKNTSASCYKNGSASSQERIGIIFPPARHHDENASASGSLGLTIAHRWACVKAHHPTNNQTGLSYPSDRHHLSFALTSCPKIDQRLESYTDRHQVFGRDRRHVHSMKLQYLGVLTQMDQLHSPRHCVFSSSASQWPTAWHHVFYGLA